MSGHELGEAGNQVEGTGCVERLSRWQPPCLGTEGKPGGWTRGSLRQVGEQRLKSHLRLVGLGKVPGRFAFSLFKSGSDYCVEDESEGPQGAMRRASQCSGQHFSAGW